jgi:hypothetical protein
LNKENFNSINDDPLNRAAKPPTGARPKSAKPNAQTKE